MNKANDTLRSSIMDSMVEIRQGDYLSNEDQTALFLNILRLVEDENKNNNGKITSDTVALLIDISTALSIIDEEYSDRAYMEALRVSWMRCANEIISILAE
jgi:hypothetical protein